MSGLSVPLSAAAASFLMAAALGPVAIPLLRRLKFGQSIREEGPKWHSKKQGTPTMGGLIFIVGIVLATLCFGVMDYMKGDLRPVLGILMACGFGFVGFIDDYIKAVKKRNLGLTAKQKFLLQLLVGAAYLCSMSLAGYLDTQLYIPFFNIKIELGIFYYALALFLIAGLVNGVNLTDGLDGLASSVTVPVAILFTVIAWQVGLVGTSAFGAAVAGGLCGFLIYNANPAKVFMGDTGSLFLGGAVCALGFSLNMPLVIVVAGFLYCFEAISDILQVCYFKATHGKRLFKMAPFHHHLELCGMSERKIVALFTIITVLLCIVSYMGVAGFYFV